MVTITAPAITQTGIQEEITETEIVVMEVMATEETVTGAMVMEEMEMEVTVMEVMATEETD